MFQGKMHSKTKLHCYSNCLHGSCASNVSKFIGGLKPKSKKSA